MSSSPHSLEEKWDNKVSLRGRLGIDFLSYFVTLQTANQKKYPHSQYNSDSAGIPS